MAFIKFLTAQFFLHRSYSTKFVSKIPKWVQKKKSSYQQNYEKNSRKKVSWTEEQLEILRHLPGHNVFITGPAGTGKSVVGKEAEKILWKIHGKSRVFGTASTGIAACTIKGHTIHSFAGIGSEQGDRDTLLGRVLSDKGACYRWRKARALLVVEISMLDARLFENLEFIARKVRGSDEVWGGLQLVVTGDFFQLPPVFKKMVSSGKEFAFEADCWDASFDYQFELTKPFRQSDPRLLSILQSIRTGNISDEDLEFLQDSCSVAEPDPLAVQLYPRIDDVNRVNDERLKALSKGTTIYQAFDEGKPRWKRQLASGVAPDRLCLCVGARVMLIKNLNVWRGLVNGATGTVTGFADGKVLPDINPDNLLPVVKFDSGQELMIQPKNWEVMEGGQIVASRQQIPLVLAWAFSIHKCQGMSLDRIHTDLSRAFGWGMVYVSLSRATSLKGLELSGLCSSKIMAHPKVVKFYKDLACKKEDVNKDDDGWKRVLLKMLIYLFSKRENTPDLVFFERIHI